MSERGYNAATAEDIIAEMTSASASRRNDIAKLLLYSTHDRPLAREEQQRLFLSMARLDTLEPRHMLNARAAAAHKSLELCDEAAVLSLLPLLEQALEESRALPWRGSIRHNRIHAGFSLAYVLLLASLYDGAERFDAAATRVAEMARGLPTDRLGRGFFRTAANVTKCLGLIGVREMRRGAMAETEAISDTIRRALTLAVEARALQESYFPVSKSRPRKALARSGPLSDVENTNEFRENMRANHIGYCLFQAVNPDCEAALRAQLGDAALKSAVSNAYPGERDAQVRRFNALFPDQTR